jgi:c-di-GMP-binding flagellar brake protein YcgR
MERGSIHEDNRKSKRAFFTLDEGVSAVLNIPGNGRVPVILLSISSGGVGIVGTRYKLPPISVGDRLILTDIRGPLPLGRIERAEVMVRSVNDNDKRLRMSYGCEFIEIQQNHCTRIHSYVQSRFHKLGLNGQKLDH